MKIKINDKYKNTVSCEPECSKNRIYGISEDCSMTDDDNFQANVELLEKNLVSIKAIFY